MLQLNSLTPGQFPGFLASVIEEDFNRISSTPLFNGSADYVISRFRRQPLFARLTPSAIWGQVYNPVDSAIELSRCKAERL